MSDASVFQDIESFPESHLRLVLCAAAFRIAAHLRALSDHRDDDALLDQYPVIGEYLRMCRSRLPRSIAWEETAGWWNGAIDRWERRSTRRLPLRALGRVTGTHIEGEIAVVLAACVEDDPRMGALFALVQGSGGSRRPTIGLIEALTDLDRAASLSTVERLLRAGYLCVDDDRLPRAERQVRLSAGVLDVLHGRPPAIPGAELLSRHRAVPLKRQIHDADMSTDIAGVPGLMASGEARALVVRVAGARRLDLVRGVARALRRDVLAVERHGDAEPTVWREIGPVCELAGLMPVAVITASGGPGMSSLDRPRGYDGPLGIVASRRAAAVSGSAGSGALYIDVPIPSPEARARIWQRAVPRGLTAPHAALAERYRLPTGSIEDLALVAATYASLAKRDDLRFSDVQRAMAALNRHAFDGLAQHVPRDGGWNALAVAQATRDDLRSLELRCRNRERLLHFAGEAARSTLTPGVRALFTGPSGTGKTLAARALAAELHMDLYRVDLAAVVNKYIGETEKNLDQLLTRAEELDVILLLDEGDALMTARTDVRTSNDRYANLETNFLLQRLEVYEGIIIVTTNAGQRIDAAFLRRIDAVISFQPPNAAERSRIWRSHLPQHNAVTASRLEAIAGLAALTGGQIRNAALHAALLALERDPEGIVGDADVEAAVRREYRIAGGSFQASLAPSDASAPARFHQLVEALGAP